jgi:hypothetical protein
MACRLVLLGWMGRFGWVSDREFTPLSATVMHVLSAVVCMPVPVSCKTSLLVTLLEDQADVDRGYEWIVVESGYKFPTGFCPLGIWSNGASVRLLGPN